MSVMSACSHVSLMTGGRSAAAAWNKNAAYCIGWQGHTPVASTACQVAWYTIATASTLSLRWKSLASKNILHHYISDCLMLLEGVKPGSFHFSLSRGLQICKPLETKYLAYLCGIPFITSGLDDCYKYMQKHITNCDVFLARHVLVINRLATVMQSAASCYFRLYY